MNKISSEQINKLPKWAQDHIKELQRQRDTAVRALNEYCDGQTPGPIYIEELECLGEGGGNTFKRRYVQGHKVTFEWNGVRLGVLLRKDEGIDLSWANTDHICRQIACIPKSFQQVLLVAKEHMR